ncbi:2-phosphosulfolactate phosphatase [Bacillus infantis]|uniref:2-phosphosulfolactate phosphatase n=1 Tax=Bacillus infantis TaxID=324767 RepID=UPI003CEEB53B
MGKIHLLLKKEEINEQKLREGSKIAVVLDILLATTSIISALKDGAANVIPAESCEKAKARFDSGDSGGMLLAGESNARPVTGFVYPSPKILRGQVSGKTLIIATANGTVALAKAEAAKKVYASSLLNNFAVAEAISEEDGDPTIVIICAGNSGEFSLEDFYGAGHLIDCLQKAGRESYVLTDAALAALLFFQTKRDDAEEVLGNSYVGGLLARHGLSDDLSFAAGLDSIHIVPVYKNGLISAAKVCK